MADTLLLSLAAGAGCFAVVFLASALGAGFATVFLAVSFLGVTVFAATFVAGLVATFLVVVVFAGFSAFFTVFLSAVLVAVFVAGFSAVFLVGSCFVVEPVALAFQPRRFNLPTMAFLDMPKRLPISDVDNPLPVKAFNFFNAMLSQPLLILQNPCYILTLDSVA